MSRPIICDRCEKTIDTVREQWCSIDPNEIAKEAGCPSGDICKTCMDALVDALVDALGINVEEEVMMFMWPLVRRASLNALILQVQQLKLDLQMAKSKIKALEEERDNWRKETFK
jgi:hypothetical protein